MSEQFKLQICKSHEVNSTPRPWDTIKSGSEQEVLKEYWERKKTLGASGDELRIVDSNGMQQAILNAKSFGEFELGPMY